MTAQEAFDARKASPGHNANMLSPNFVAIGIDRAFNHNSDFDHYWTTVFGSIAVEAAKACEDDPHGGDNSNGGMDNGNGLGNGEGNGNGDGDGEGDEDQPDRDIDGLYDDETDIYGTDPDEYDTDDGYTDGEEVFYVTDPLDTDSYLTEGS
jgi:hypothetical protein